MLRLALFDRIASRRRSLGNMSLVRARSSLYRPASLIGRPIVPLRLLTTPLGRLISPLRYGRGGQKESR